MRPIRVLKKYLLSLLMGCFCLVAFELYPLTLTVDRLTDNGGYVGEGSGDDRKSPLVSELYQYSWSDTYDIGFSVVGTISLNRMLPVVNLFQSANTVNIQGSNNITIDGQGIYRAFIARQGSLSIQNLTIQNCIAIGGDGGDFGGGGGLGAGGAIFSDAASLFLTGITFLNCKAQGGNGGSGKQ